MAKRKSQERDGVAAAARLAQHRAEIVERWAERTRDELPAARRNGRLTLEDEVPQFLSHLARALADSNSEPQTLAVSREYAKQRVQTPGYSFDQILLEYQLLLNTILELIEADGPITSRARSIILRSIHQGTREAARYFSDAREEERTKLLDRERAARAASESAERRAAFLAEASTLLAGSLDYQATLKSVARLVVPQLADWCLIDSVEEDDGSIRRLAVAHSDPSRAVECGELDRRYALAPKARSGPPRVLRTGQSEIYSELMPAPADVAEGAEHFRLFHQLGFRSVMIVPLLARGRTLGAITFAAAESGRRYGASDLALAEDVARRAALAVDNARLFHEAQEAVHARDDFLSIASHELRTPLTSLLLLTQILLRAVRQGSLATIPHDRALSMLETSERQTKELAKLINDLLEISRLIHGRLELHFQQVDLSTVVNNTVKQVGDELAAAGCATTVRIDGPAEGRWDRARIEQVVSKLLINAMKYGRGKPIAVRVDTDESTVRLTIEDQGVGIAPEQVERIFARFERAVTGQQTTGGLGLDLYIVRHIIDAHGGSIRVTSEPGRGSVFTVELPREKPATPVRDSAKE